MVTRSTGDCNREEIRRRQRPAALRVWAVALAFTFMASIGFAQSGSRTGSGRRIVTLNVIAHAPEGRQVTKEDFDLYDGGVLQEIESFGRLDAGSRIVLLVDNSSNLKADGPALEKAMLSIIDELYQDDQMMVVFYNEQAEIIEDMTPDLQKLRATSTKVIRKGFPKLFDALVAVADSLSSQASTGSEKRAIVLISDGYDSESKTKFDETLRELQDTNVVLYAIQVADRTRGALLRDRPKPPVALERLTVATAGAVFPFDKVEEAAKAIADDLRKNWYRLIYSPSGINTINMRRLLLMSHDKNIALRTKGSHPSKYHTPY